MSLGSMFSSPGKQASQAAQGQANAMQGVLGNLEQYVTGQQQQLRQHIEGSGPNPYFQAAQQINPQAYYTRPNEQTQFSASGPGLTGGEVHTQGASTPPGLPPVILSSEVAPAPPSPPSTPPPVGGGPVGPIAHPMPQPLPPHGPSGPGIPGRGRE